MVFYIGLELIKYFDILKKQGSSDIFVGGVEEEI
tara:strand:- start:1 stop:102 length:102 start_codon:yes stop_codon:yes gene_type:complete